MPLPFPDGKPVLQHIVDRCKLARTVDTVVIATTSDTSDDAVCRILPDCTYRGSAEDVLDRYYQTARQFGLDIIVRLTADNPCVDYDTIDRMVKRHIARENNYTRTVGLPMGVNLQIVSFDALETAWKQSTDRYDREHVLPYIARNEKQFKVDIAEIKVTESFQKVRLTMDYPSDYAMMNFIFSNFRNHAFSLAEIAQLLEDHSWISSINPNYQKRKFASLNEEIDAACDILSKLEMPQAVKTLKSRLK